MEKTSSTNYKSSSLPFLVLIGSILLHSILNWSHRVQKLFSTFQSLLQIQHHGCHDSSNVWDEKHLDSDLSQLVRLCEKKDDGSLSREDAMMVMGNLGIFCSSEGEQLPESFCSNELFDEKEPSLEEVKQAFDVYDENKDGFIDPKELQRVLCILGLKEGSKLENCQKMIRTFDENGDGRIEFSEFVKFMEASFC